jgi:hypothetical protein
VYEKASNSDWLVEARECVKKLSSLTGLLGKFEKVINLSYIKILKKSQFRCINVEEPSNLLQYSRVFELSVMKINKEIL